MFTQLTIQNPQQIELKTLDFRKKFQRELFRASKLNELFLLDIIRNRHSHNEICTYYRELLQNYLYAFQSQLTSPLNDFQKLTYTKEYVDELQDFYAEFKNKML